MTADRRAPLRAFPVIFVAAIAIAACGPRAIPAGSAAWVEGAVLKMRHQISFRSAGDVQVFDGYMLLAGERLRVEAFAGPGVDLFTVVRDGAAHREALHIPGLADRIDMTAVAADIARVYLGGCGAADPGAEARCEFYGEPMIEARGPDGRLSARRFPEAHGVGLAIEYAEPEACAGEERPARITLRWGSSANEMTIRLVGCETPGRVDPAVFSTAP